MIFVFSPLHPRVNTHNPTYLSIEKTHKHRKRKPHQTTMPIRLDNNGKRKALICEELKPETRYEEHVRIEEEKEFKKQRKNKRAINKMKSRKITFH